MALGFTTGVPGAPAHGPRGDSEWCRIVATLVRVGPSESGSYPEPASDGPGAATEGHCRPACARARRARPGGTSHRAAARGAHWQARRTRTAPSESPGVSALCRAIGGEKSESGTCNGGPLCMGAQGAPSGWRLRRQHSHRQVQRRGPAPLLLY